MEQELITLIRQKLPELMKAHPEIREWVLEVAGERFADRAQTEGRFEQMLAELRQMREESERRWQDWRQEWQAYREEMERRWQEQLAAWRQEWQAYREEMERRWQEQREESERRWQENQNTIRKLTQRIESGIGALGARWGIFAESAFRNGIRAILEESFGVQVIHFQGYDEKGNVFGHPDQVELDLIVKDGMLIVCEIASSMSRSDMYTFDRKVQFYEQTEGRRADRKIVISPMVEERALRVAQNLGIEVYTHAEDVINSKPPAGSGND